MPMNVGSDMQIKKYLYSLGWRPDEWNTKRQDDGSYIKASPKISESSFGSIPNGMGADIKRYRMLKHRRGLIQSPNDPSKGAMGKVRYDGRVPATAVTCGTPTTRYRHSGAVCNIPRPSSPLGKEIRELYGVELLNWMVGIDLSGIEARMLGHFCTPYDGGAEFAKLITTGDWHSANAALWGCSRNDAKTFLYALMYGAGPLKLGNILGESKASGKRKKEAFFRAYGPYDDLTKALEKAVDENDGFIRGLDGRRLYVRAKKDALSTCLQGNAAIVFKRWMVESHVKVVSQYPRGDVKQIIAYHDELQYEFVSTPGLDNKENAELFGQKVVKVAKEVGISFNLHVPIDAEAKVGKNWKECH